MLCVIPFFPGDAAAAERLLCWIRDLGPSSHDCLLVADDATRWEEVLRCVEIAQDAFDTVEVISNGKTVEGWIPGSNSLFKAAAQFAQDRGRSFLFLEPDAVPICKNWLSAIEKSYEACSKPFMGSVVYHNNPGWPNPYFEGVGVYPHDAWRRMQPHFREDVSWTQACEPAVIPMAENSALFQHLWGEYGNPPTFGDRAIPGTNVFSLDQLQAGAVVFHRNKDGALIRKLRQKLNINPEASRPLLVVLPFCNKDATVFMQTLDWARTLELPSRIPFACLLSYETGTTPTNLQGMRVRAANLFDQVLEVQYPAPRNGVWPPTIAFIETAKAIQNVWTGPWFWTEYDLIPVRRGWVQAMWTEYQRGRKPFMGPIVPGQGHMNGTGIYPPDTPARIPRAMLDLKVAWDVAMKKEMIRDCHDCGHVLQHVWVMDGYGRFLPTGGGAAPSFRRQEALNQLRPGIYCFHRCKDGSLIQRLKERHRA